MFASLARPMILPSVCVRAPDAVGETVVAPALTTLADELSDADLEHVVGGLVRSYIPPILVQTDSHVVSEL